jgi:hypothetical protein
LSPLGDDCTETEIAALFESEIWPWHGRCTGCHWENGASREDYPSAPLIFTWVAGAEPSHNSMLTMYNMIGLDMIDTVSPADSRLLTKPLEEDATASSSLGVSTGIFHAGGTKIAGTGGGEAEAAFVDFVDWISAYVACYNAG